MRHTRGFFTLLVLVSLSLFATETLIAQDSKAALQRGYRTGYSDGYMAGYRDSIDNAAKDVRRHSEYGEAKRAYHKDYGTLEDYSDGYRQGFESGYDTGFEKRSFESAVPLTLAKRGALAVEPSETTLQQSAAAAAETNTVPAAEPVVEERASANVAQPENVEPASTQPAAAEPAAPVQPSIQKVAYTPQGDDPIIIIPRDTELIIEIQEPLSTETNRVGDKFTAKIVSPYEITGAIIEGRIERITRPGRIKRRAEMLLTFDRIVINEQRWSNYSAIVTEVLPVKGDNIKTVDNEGAAVGKRSIKEDAIKVGATTGAGLGIGALTAGPVGAAVGAGVGAAFGVGAVVIERGKHIHINENQQLRIRTAYETKIR